MACNRGTRWRRARKVRENGTSASARPTRLGLARRAAGRVVVFGTPPLYCRGLTAALIEAGFEANEVTEDAGLSGASPDCVVLVCQAATERLATCACMPSAPAIVVIATEPSPIAYAQTLATGAAAVLSHDAPPDLVVDVTWGSWSRLGAVESLIALAYYKETNPGLAATAQHLIRQVLGDTSTMGDTPHLICRTNADLSGGSRPKCAD